MEWSNIVKVYIRTMIKWIADVEESMKLLITVDAHCRMRGHHAYNSTMDIISQSYWCLDLKENV